MERKALKMEENMVCCEMSGAESSGESNENDENGV